MTATLKDAEGTSSLVLIHGPARPTADYAQGHIGDGLKFAARLEVQVSPLIGGAYRQVLSHGNHGGELSFSALRQFTTLEAAGLWAAQHPLAVGGLTRLWLNWGGASSVVLWGAMQSADPECRGVTVSIQYSWTYGNVTLDPGEEE
jgi:hypothetical protein